MPGTLRGAEPVATMISFVAVSVCLPPSCSVTSTRLPPVSRAVPLIQSILFFLNSISMPPVRPAIILSLRACTAAMSMRHRAPSMPVRPHSFAACAIFSACACSSSALVGMQPQMRQVPPSAFCFSTTATFKPELRRANRGHVPAGARANDDDVVLVGHTARSLPGLRLKTCLCVANPTASMSLGTEPSRSSLFRTTAARMSAGRGAAAPADRPWPSSP